MTDPDALEKLRRMYEACGEGHTWPTVRVCNLAEYQKYQILDEPGWPEGRPTLEEFYRNTPDELRRLKAALLAEPEEPK